MVGLARIKNDAGERWVYLSFVVPLMLVISISLVLEWFTIWGWADWYWVETSFAGTHGLGIWSFAFVPALLGAAALVPFYPTGEPWPWRILLAALFSIMAGGLRFGVEYVVWGSSFLVGPVMLEGSLSVAVPFFCIVVSMYLAKSQIRSIETERRITEMEFQSRQDALEHENAELKVRRELSSVLHDQVQQRLVFAATRLQHELLPLAVERKNETAQELLQEIIADIDQLREDDVRKLSHTLFPLGADLGLHQAISLVVARVPPSVKIDLAVTDAAANFDSVVEPQLDMALRAVLAAILDESITNAIKHGQADSISVGLDLTERNEEQTVVLTVNNNGVPVERDPVLSGLASHRARAEIFGGGLTLGLDSEGQTLVTVWLPVNG
ncbi:MAG: hypothetical protein LBO75_02685 [Bifidobacteriaceae bacterium]|nr:hypothetical protein [Bifidobacteriaceae bacterium]